MLNKTVSDLKLGTAALKEAAAELDTAAVELEDAVAAVVQNVDPSVVPAVATAPSLGATSTIDTAVSGPVQAVPAKSGNAGNVSRNESLEMYPMTGKLERDP
jgi:hypothetical protein